MAKAAFNKTKTLFTSKLDLNLMKKLVKCYIWSMALYGAESWALRAADQKYLESFEMRCWRRMEKISWTDHVRNEDVLLSVNEQRNIVCFLLGDPPASDLYMPTSAYINQTPGNHPKENKQHSEHGESLKSKKAEE